MDWELNASIGRKLITTPLDVNDNIVRKDKLAFTMEMVLSLDKHNNTVWKMEDSATSYLGIMRLVLKSSRTLDQLHPSIRDLKMSSSLP